MKKRVFAGSCLSGFLLFGNLASGQDLAGPNDKAKRYHTLLLKRPGNPTVFSRFVDAWLDTGDKKQMKDWLKESAKNGGVPEWRVLAAFYEYLGEDEAALDAFNEAVGKDEKDASLRLARAKLQAKLLSFEAALKDLEVATSDDKLGVEASKLQGIYLARAGRIDEAVTAWKKVIERFPKDEELREDLIEVEVVEGLYDDAIAASQELVGMTRDPYKKALRQLRLADIQILGNKREDGLKTYEAIMAATGAGTWLEREVLAQVERVFMREDDIQGLRDFFQKMRETHPRRVSVRKALARQMALNGEMDEAIALFREIIKITPGDIGNREEFIGFLETNERWKDAREELSELIKQREGDPLLWERMARIEEKLKNEEGVKVALAKVRDLKKGTAEGLIAVAALYSQAKLPAEAEALLREGRKEFADSDELTEALASFLIQNKKEEEALAIWTEMAAKADREGLLRVARSLTGHGKSDAAFKMLEKRMGEFGEDPLILAQFCNLAFSEEEAIVALPFGMELVRRSLSPTDLESAIRTAGRVINRASKQDETLRDLEAKEAPTIPERCLIAELFAAQGDSLKALEVLKAAEEADDGLLARFYRVRFDENRGELEGAIASLREILELPEGRKTVHMRRLVGLLEKFGDLTGALEAVAEWKRMAPGDQAAWMRRADLLSSHGEPDQAVLELRRMIGKFGAEEDSRARLAAALLEANEHRSAQRIYEQLYEEGEDLQVKLKWVAELAKVAQREGTLDELLADFERRKRENPKSVAPLLALAEIYHVLNQYENRRSALLEASRRRPNDLKLLHYIADVEERAGELERAVGTLKDAARSDTTPATKRKLAALYLKNGEYQAGLRLLKELPDEANDPRKIETTAMSLLTRAEWDLAVTYLSDLRVRHADDWRLQYLYALCLVMDGQEDMALKVYRGLLDADRSIKGLKPIFDPKTMNVYWKRQIQSKVTMNGWPKMQMLQNQIGSEEENLREINSGYSSFGRNRLVNLPGTPEEVRMMSFLKASALAAKLPEDERESVMAGLTVAGVERLDLFQLSRLDNKELFAKVNKLLKAEPDNPAYLNLWLTSRYAVEKDERGGPEILRKALSAVSEKSPINAVNLISGMLYQKEMEPAEAVTLLEGFLEVAKESEDRPDILSSMTNIVNRYSQQAKNKEFDGLKKQLVQEAVAVEKKPKDRRWIDLCLVMAMNEGYQDESIVLINRISEWLREDKAVASLNPNNYYYGSGYGSYSSSYRGGYGRNQGTLSPPQFPPTAIQGVPRFVAQEIAKKLASGETQELDKVMERRLELLAKLKEGEEEEEAKNGVKVPKPLETLRGKTGELESRLLATLVESALGDKEALDRFVKEAANSKKLDELQLAAGYLWKKKKKVETYEVLTRMRMLTLSRTERRQVDGQLAMTGSLLASEEGIEWDKEPAQRASLRLRKLLTGSNERPALMMILTKLGLQKEAEKLDATPGSSARSASAARLASRRGGRQGIVSLVGDGRKEEAAREAAKLYRRLSANRNSQYELQQLIETVDKLDLAELTLEKIHPGDSESVTRRLAYAKFAMAAKKPDLARPVFKELVAERPKLMEAQAGLFLTMPNEERDYSAFLEADEEGNVNTEGLVQVMTNLWSRADDVYSETLALMDLTAGILKGLEPDSDPKRNLTWVSYFVISSTQDVYYNGVQIGPYYHSRKNQSFDAEKTKRFDEVFLRVLLEMIKHPQLAEQGFMMLRSAKESIGITDEELLKHAKTALAQVVKRQKSANDNPYNGSQALWVLVSQHGTSSGYSLENAIGPIEYLVSKGGGEDVITGEMLESLKEHQPERFENLTFARDLAKMDPDEGLKRFDKWYAGIEKDKDDKKRSDQQINSSLVTFAQDLMLFEFKPSVWTDELESKLLQIKSNDWNDSSGWSALSRKWLAWIARNEGEEGIREFLGELCEAQMGSRDKWPILAELGERNLPNDYRQRVYSLSNQLQGFYQIEEAFRPLVDLSMEHEFDKVLPNYNLQSRISTAMRKHRTPDSLVEWLKKTGMLAPVPDGKYDPLRTLGTLTLIDQFYMRGTDDWKKFVELAEKANLDPLYMALVRLKSGTSDPKKNVAAEIWEERIDLLRAMREQNEKTTNLRIVRWFPDYQAKGAGPKLAAFLKELSTSELDELRKKGETWLADGIEIDRNDYRGQKLWTEIAAIGKLDPKLASDLATKVLTRVQTDPSLNRSRSSYGGIYTVAMDSWNRYFLETLLRRSDGIDLLAKMKIIHAVYHGELGDSLLEPSSTGGNVSYYMRQAFDNGLRGIEAKDDSKLLKIQQLLMRASKELSDEEQATFISLIYPNMLQSGRFQAKGSEEGIKFADETLRPESPLLADFLKLLVKTCAISGLKSEETKARFKESADLFKEMLPRWKVSSGFAMDFAAGVMAQSNGSILFAGEDQWKWLTEKMVKHSQGQRNIALSSAFRVFRYLSAQEFEGKEKAAKHLMSSLDGTLLTPDLFLKYRNYRGSDSWVNHVLPLALDAGDAELAKRLIQQNTQSFRGQLGLMLRVARSIDAKSAARLAPATTLRYSVVNPPGYEKETPKVLAEILKVLPARDHYRLEVMVAGLQDSKVEGKAPETNRSDRLVELGKHYAEKQPKDSGPRWQLLNVFATDDKAAKLLLPEFQKEATKLSYAVAISLGSEGGRSADSNALKSIIKRWLTEEMEAGRPELILKEIKGLAEKAGGNNGYNYRYAGVELTHHLGGYLLQESAKNPEKAKQLAALSAENLAHRLKMEPGGYDDPIKGLVWNDLFVHVLAGKTLAWYERVKKLDENLLKPFEGPLGKKKDRYGLQQLTNHRDYMADEKSELRKAIVAAALRDTLFLEAVVNHYTIPSLLMDARILTRAELYTVIDEIPDDHPRKAEFLMEKAGIMGWREEKIEEAEKIYKKARELALSQRNEKIVHLTDALHARLLGQKNRISESWKYGQRVDPAKLDESDRRWFDSDSKKWMENYQDPSKKPEEDLKKPLPPEGKKEEPKSSPKPANPPQPGDTAKPAQPQPTTVE